MPQAKNLESVRAFFERVLNAGDVATLESFSHRDVLVPQSAPGIESFRRLLVDMRSTFANPEYKVMDTVCEGEKVVAGYAFFNDVDRRLREAQVSIADDNKEVMR